jgi:phage protein D
MGDYTNTPKFELLIDGSAASSAVIESVITIRVRHSLNEADCLDLQLSNADLAWSESDMFDEGKLLTVKLGYEETSLVQVFQGEIVRRDCDFPVRGPAIVTVVAFDKQCRLRRERRSRTWLSIKDSAVISELASEVGLSPDVKATQAVMDYLVQWNQSDLSFLRERCDRLGYVLIIDEKDKKLSAKPVEETSPVAKLKWGRDLLAFSSRMTIASQLSEVTFRGWDMVKKEKIEEKLAASAVKAKFGGADLGAKLAEKAGGSRKALYTQVPIYSSQEATQLATARMNDAAQNYAIADGCCQGNPKVRVGLVVEVEAVGARSNGKYLVHKALHHYQPGLGYSTHFSLNRPTERVGASKPEPLPESVPAREGGESSAPEFIEFEVRSMSGEDVAGWSYTATLPNGEVRTGVLDDSGKIRLEGIRDPGEAKIELGSPPELDPLA